METRELASRAQVMLLVGRWVLFRCLAIKRTQRFRAVLDGLINTWPPNYIYSTNLGFQEHSAVKKRICLLAVL